jgi:hypothetical protein
LVDPFVDVATKDRRDAAHQRAHIDLSQPGRRRRRRSRSRSRRHYGELLLDQIVTGIPFGQQRQPLDLVSAAPPDRLANFVLLLVALQPRAKLEGILGTRQLGAADAIHVAMIGEPGRRSASADGEAPHRTVDLDPQPGLGRAGREPELAPEGVGSRIRSGIRSTLGDAGDHAVPMRRPQCDRATAALVEEDRCLTGTDHP